ncbi:MAG: phosphate uptake regulator PhoU [Nitrososphaerota archaeon]|nr:phosphate uptake regulator PhoU [Nitrososphaerota archaeon]
MDYRKLQKLGGGTLFVSMPKAWVEANGLKKGDVVGLEEATSGILVVSVEKSGASRAGDPASLTVYGDDMMYVRREVVAAYLSGRDIIRVQFRPHGYRTRRMAKEVAKELLGLELVEEDQQSVTFHYMLDTDVMVPSKIFSRMNALSKSMYVDATRDLPAVDQDLMLDILERDGEIDRLYFLGVRMLRQAASNAAEAARMGLTNTQALDYRVAFHHLEYLADMAHRLVEQIQRTGPDEPQSRALKSTAAQLSSLQDLAYLYFIGARKEKYQEFLTSSAAAYRSMEAVGEGMRDVLASLREMHRLIVDIADLAGTLYPYVR